MWVWMVVCPHVSAMWLTGDLSMTNPAICLRCINNHVISIYLVANCRYISHTYRNTHYIVTDLEWTAEVPAICLEAGLFPHWSWHIEHSPWDTNQTILNLQVTTPRHTAVRVVLFWVFVLWLAVLFWKVTLLLFQVTCPSSCVIRQTAFPVSWLCPPVSLYHHVFL